MLKNPKTLGYWPFIIWSLTIAVLMLLPSDKFPESKLFSYDKLAHVGVFAIHSFLLNAAMVWKGKGKTINTYLLSLTICVVYGSILEFLQTFVPGRMTDLYDFIANCMGGLVGVIIFSIFTRQKFVNTKLNL